MQRLIAVLSCRGVRKASLSDNTALDGAARLSEEDMAALRGAGWRSGTTLRELLNYAGELSLLSQGFAASRRFCTVEPLYSLMAEDKSSAGSCDHSFTTLPCCKIQPVQRAKILR